MIGGSSKKNEALQENVFASNYSENLNINDTLYSQWNTPWFRQFSGMPEYYNSVSFNVEAFNEAFTKELFTENLLLFITNSYNFAYENLLVDAAASYYSLQSSLSINVFDFTNVFQEMDEIETVARSLVKIGGDGLIMQYIYSGLNVVAIQGETSSFPTPPIDVLMAIPDVYSTLETQALTVSASQGILTNDYDANTATSISIFSIDGLSDNIEQLILLSQGAQLIISSDGSLFVDPNGHYQWLGLGETFEEQISYQIQDEDGKISLPSIVSIIIEGLNDLPATQNDLITLRESTNLVVAPSLGLLANDFDPDASAVLKVHSINNDTSLVNQPFILGLGASIQINEYGDYQINTNKAYDYLKDSEFVELSFEYNIVDEHDTLSNTATVVVRIDGENTAPYVADDVYQVQENKNLSVSGKGVLSNDSDPDSGTKFSVYSVNGSSDDLAKNIQIGDGGVLNLKTNGRFTFRTNKAYDYLALGEIKAETFNYQVIDNLGAISDLATVTIDVIGVNDAPVSAQDKYNVAQSVLSVINPLDGLLSNDFDIDNNASLAIGRVNGKADNIDVELKIGRGALFIVDSFGGIEFNPNGKYDYLAQNKSATISFNYQTVDEHGAFSKNTKVSLTIVGENDAAVAFDDVRTVSENSQLKVGGKGILSNDKDIDQGSILSVAEVAGDVSNVGQTMVIGQGGLLTINANGSYVFNTNNSYDFIGKNQTFTESVDYRAQDQFGAMSNIANLEIIIKGVNDRPVGEADHYIASNTTVLSVSAANGLLSNDYDLDQNATLSVTRVNNKTSLVGNSFALKSGALLTVNQDGSYDYDPNGKFDNLIDGESALDSFTYRLSDEFGSMTGNVKVSIEIIADSVSMLSQTVLQFDEIIQNQPALFESPNANLAHGTNPGILSVNSSINDELIVNNPITEL